MVTTGAERRQPFYSNFYLAYYENSCLGKITAGYTILNTYLLLNPSADRGVCGVAWNTGLTSRFQGGNSSCGSAEEPGSAAQAVFAMCVHHQTDQDSQCVLIFL